MFPIVLFSVLLIAASNCSPVNKRATEETLDPNISSLNNVLSNSHNKNTLTDFNQQKDRNASLSPLSVKTKFQSVPNKNEDPDVPINLTSQGSSTHEEQEQESETTQQVKESIKRMTASSLQGGINKTASDKGSENVDDLDSNSTQGKSPKQMKDDNDDEKNSASSVHMQPSLFKNSSASNSEPKSGTGELGETLNNKSNKISTASNIASKELSPIDENEQTNASQVDGNEPKNASQVDGNDAEMPNASKKSGNQEKVDEKSTLPDRKISPSSTKKFHSESDPLLPLQHGSISRTTTSIDSNVTRGESDDGDKNSIKLPIETKTNVTSPTLNSNKSVSSSSSPLPSSLSNASNITKGDDTKKVVASSTIPSVENPSETKPLTVPSSNEQNNQQDGEEQKQIESTNTKENGKKDSAKQQIDPIENASEDTSGEVDENNGTNVLQKPSNNNNNNNNDKEIQDSAENLEGSNDNNNNKPDDENQRKTPTQQKNVVNDNNINRNNQESKYPQDFSANNVDDEEDGGVFNYFLTFVALCGICFLIFHNKKRIIATVVEGKRPRGRGESRRRSSSSYRKLENNFD